MSNKRPIIGCTTYRKVISQDPLIEVDGLMPTYTGAIFAAGGLPVMIPPTLNDDALLDWLDSLDGLLLPGGGDIDPARYGGSGDSVTVYGVDTRRDHIEFLLTRHAVEIDKPLLAICRGHQLLNIVRGGSLWEDLQELMPNAMRHAYFRGYARDQLSHPVQIRENSKLHTILKTTNKAVNSIHHQGIRHLGSDLTAVAHAPDGLIEGVELEGHRFAIGIQWHPEEFFQWDGGTAALFQSFIGACRS